MKQESPRFSQQAINRIAQIAIASQLKQEVQISVDIATTLNQIAKGQIDAIAILIRGLVLSDRLKTEEFQLDIGAVTVKPLSAMKGRIQLRHPSQGKLRVVVHQDDLTIALNQLLPRDSAGGAAAQTLPLSSSVRCFLDDQAMTVQFSSPFSPPFSPTDASAEAESIVLTAVPLSAEASERRIGWQLSSNQFDSESVSILLNHLDRLLSLKDFEQKGLFLSIEEIQIADGKLQIDANALIQEFPPD